MPKRGMNNNGRMEVKDIALKGKTILEQFQNFISEHRKVSDIITFISIQNARFIGLSGTDKISEEKKMELHEFYDYFMENFDDLTFEARMENWGQEPYIFRLVESLMEEEERQLLENYVATLPICIKKEARTLCDTLFSIREHRVISYVTKEDRGTFEIPKTIYHSELKEARDTLYLICCYIVEELGVLTVRLRKEDHDEIFGIRILPIGIWSPIGKEEMQKAHCTGPNGIVLEPEADVVYTDIMRERF